MANIVQALEQQDRYAGLSLSETLAVGNLSKDPQQVSNPLSNLGGAKPVPDQALETQDQDPGALLSSILSDKILKSNLGSYQLVDHDRLRCIDQ